MTVLIVVAHPDDEVLGVGATVARWAEQGVEIHVCMLSGSVEARGQRPDDDELLADITEAQRLLGIGEPLLGDFPNIRFNTVPHLALVQFIEQAIKKHQATVILTHHPNDLNDDHRVTSQACQAAARLHQRGADVPPLKGLYFMEVLSSTDWIFRGTEPFQPDTFVEVGEAALDRKLEALRAYRGVMRPYPHPRSEESIRGLAAYRGGQAAMRYAEAFQTAFHTLSVGP